jgi:tetratricopeptide (TPR) repeat protein
MRSWGNAVASFSFMKLTFIIIIIIIWSILSSLYSGNTTVIPSVIAQNSEEDVDSLRSKATEAYINSRYQEAIEYLDRALAIEPYDPSILSSKGLALAHLGRYEEAIEYYDRALAIQPNNVYALNNKANALVSSIEPVEPVVYYDNDAFTMRINYQFISPVTIENTPANTIMAFEEIIKLYDRALAIDPNDTIVITNKGIVLLYNLTSPNEAIEMFDQGLEIDPNHVGCLYNKGVALEKLGRGAEATQYKDRAQEMDPTYSGELIDKEQAVATELRDPI